MTEPTRDPANLGAELRRRRDARRAEEAAAHARSGRLGLIRLVLAALALALVLAPLAIRASWPWWALLPVAAAFMALAAAQTRAERDEGEAAACRRYWADELARLDEQWRALADDGEDLRPDGDAPESAQSLAADLDLFGPASLFQLLSRATTEHGRRTLAAWLLTPAAPADRAARRAAIEALRDAPDARETFARAARGLADTRLGDAALIRWGTTGAPWRHAGLARVVGLALPVANVAALAVWALREDFGPFLASAIATGVVILATRSFVAERTAHLAAPDRSLRRYAALLEAAETAAVSAPRLDALRARLRATDGARPAHAELTQLLGLVTKLESSHNVFFALSVGPLLLWDLNVVLRAEAWRARVGPRLPGWFEALGELEALASLGAHAALRPSDTFAELVDAPGTFEAEGLSHPLIDRGRVVANDVRLGGAGSVLLLSGSNMSGKSTLLRAIGLAIVLAGAGAPVAARRLRASRFRVETSIRVVDSLASGASHFYAELRRVRSIVEAGRADGAALLYLLDEMLHGTNSRERYVGAVSVMRFLARAGAVGVVTTHDLELARVADELPPGAVTNAHFGDDVEDARITFDYVLKPGPVRSTNALRLMRAMGIDIELSAPDLG